jgi:putative tricarboxylic transport membrane protein
MEILHNLVFGFQVSLQPINLLYCFVGVFLGTLIGVLPGIGPIGTMAILLPATFYAPPVSSIIMLAGIFYGAMYGGSTTAILVNIPGEAASVITCIDGYKMARQGRAGPALGIAAFGSFIAGTLGLVGLVLIAYPLARWALKFGPPEFFSLMVLGLIILAFLAQKSFIKSIIMATLGLLLSYVGLDIVSGRERFTLNIIDLMEGIGIVPIVMGLYGITEILENLAVTVPRSIFKTHVKELLPNLKDWRNSIGAILRGTGIGFLLGVLPGAAAIVSTFVSYGMEKKISKHPERFGEGAIEGVAGPESANNAAASGGFVPLMALGIPPNGIMAMLFCGLLIHGLQPGPLLLREHPDIFWGIITSMYIGNVMLLILNLPLIGMWIQILKVPFRLLFPVIILVCLVGVYSINLSVFGIWVMIIFGVFGYFLKKCDYEFAPLVLAYVLGPMLENSLRQSLIMSKGSFAIFFSRPISGVCFAIAATLLIGSAASHLKGRIKRRRQRSSGDILKDG